jgi:hypothetical protein
LSCLRQFEGELLGRVVATDFQILQSGFCELNNGSS